MFGRESYALRMIACTGRNHPDFALGSGQPSHAVISSPDFEAEDRLLVFTFKPDGVLHSARKPACDVQRCLSGDLVDAASQDSSQNSVKRSRHKGRLSYTSAVVCPAKKTVLGLPDEARMQPV